MRGSPKFFLAFALICTFFYCAPGKKAKVTPQQLVEYNSIIQQAAVCYEGTEPALLNRIKEIENSTFSEERKQRHIMRKKALLKKIRLTKATAFYNAAAGYFNAGMKERALHLAQKAALHESLKEKAEELIATIKKRARWNKGEFAFFFQATKGAFACLKKLFLWS